MRQPLSSTLILLSLACTRGCAPSDDVPLNRVNIDAINDATLLLDIDGDQVWTESSRNIKLWQLSVLTKPGEPVYVPPRPFPAIESVVRTGAPDTPYFATIGDERLRTSRMTSQ
jgi:hypothetical protein